MIKSEKSRKLTDAESIRVAANFRRLRKERGETQKSLGLKSNPPVTPAHIAHIENCEVGLGKNSREKYARILNCDVSEFLKPIDETELDRELSSAIKEMRLLSVQQVKQLRRLMPYLLDEEDTNAGGIKKKPNPKKNLA